MNLHRQPLKLLVSGPYGGLNYGDDAIAMVICSELRRRGAEVVLAVSNIEGARCMYSDIPVVERLDLRRGRLFSLQAIRELYGMTNGGSQSCGA